MTITFKDHLGRQITQADASLSKDYIVEKTDTNSLDCKWHRFIYPQFASHLDRNDPFFTACETKDRIINLREIHIQRARTALGILSDPADQISLTGESFLHCKIRNSMPEIHFDCWERPRRFSASKLLEHHVTEEQVADVAYLFFLEALLHANLMVPNSLDLVKGFENHIFHVLSKRIIIGLPFCFMEVSDRDDDEASWRKNKLLQIFKENYPSKLCRDAEEAVTKGMLFRRIFTNIYKKEDRTTTQKFALMEMKAMGHREIQGDFFKGCADVFKKLVEEIDVLDAELDQLRFQFLNRLACGKGIAEIRESLKLYLNSSFPRQYFQAYELFMEMYENKILNTDFFIPQMFVISLEKNPRIANQKMGLLFKEFSN